MAGYLPATSWLILPPLSSKAFQVSRSRDAPPNLLYFRMLPEHLLHYSCTYQDLRSLDEGARSAKSFSGQDRAPWPMKLPTFSPTVYARLAPPKRSTAMFLRMRAPNAPLKPTAVHDILEHRIKLSGLELPRGEPCVVYLPAPNARGPGPQKGTAN